MNAPLIAVGALSVVAVAGARSTLVGNTAATTCQQMATLKLENTLIASAEPMTSGTFTPRGRRIR